MFRTIALTAFFIERTIKQNFQPKDKFNEAAQDLFLIGDTLSVDDRKLFRTTLKDQCRYYVVYSPEDRPFRRDSFTAMHDQHCQVEQYHRAIKQVCHIEHFQIHSERPVRNHIFASILSYVYLQKVQIAQVVTNIYQHQFELFKETAGACIERFAKGKDDLLPKMAGAINA